MADPTATTVDFDTRVRRTSVPLYAVAIASTWLYANLPLNRTEANTSALNLVTIPALISLIAIWFFPWHRFHRLLFLIMTLSGTALIPIAVAYSGGWRSPLAVFFLLAILFNAAYYPHRLAVVLDYVVVLSSLTPALYQWDPSAFLAHLVIFVPAGLCTGYVSDMMMTGVRRREREVASLVAQQERHEQELARLAALHRAGTAVSAHLDFRHVIEAVVHELGISLGYSLVGVYLREGEMLRLHAQLGYASPVERIASGTGIVGRVYMSGEAVLVPQVWSDPDYVAADPRVGSEVCVPILRGNTVIGVLNIESETRLDRGDLELLELFAQHVSAALANAEAHAAMVESAQQDAMTGVLNHGALVTTIEAEIAAAQRAGAALAVLFIDLDHFKDLNDRYGHAFGDIALRTCSQIIADCVAGVGILGRYGGDEFVVILPRADHERGLLIAEEIRACIAAHRFWASGNSSEDRLTASIGVAAMPEQATTATGLLNLADRASYLAKDQGRDRVSVAKVTA